MTCLFEWKAGFSVLAFLRRTDEPRQQKYRWTYQRLKEANNNGIVIN
jgi:hypothetical protein